MPKPNSETKTPPVMSELAPVSASEVNQYKSKKFDVDGALGRRGFGPFNLYYVFATSLAWCAISTLSYSDKFLAVEKEKLAPILPNHFPVPDDFKMLNKDLELDVKNMKDVVASLKSCMYLGWAVGSVIFGPIADKVGLKPVFFPGLALFVIFLFASSFCPFTGTTALYYLCGCKFMTFVCGAPFMMSSYMWMDGMTPAANKSILNIVPNVLFGVGQLTAGVSHQMFPYWRDFWKVVASLGAVHLLWYPGSVDPPSTLSKKAGKKKAIKVLKDIETVNEVSARDGLELENVSASDSDDDDDENALPTSADDGFSAEYFKNLGIMMIVWVAWAVGFWGIGNENLSGTDAYYDNTLAAVFSIPGYWLGYLVTEYFQDWRVMIMILQLPAGILLGGVGLCHQYKWVVGQQITSFTANMLMSGASAVCYVITPEIFKGSRTNTAMGAVAMCVRLGALFTSNAKNLGLGNTYFFELPAKLDKKYLTDDPKEGLEEFHLAVMNPLIFTIPTVLAACLVIFLPSGVAGKKKKITLCPTCSFSGKWSYLFSKPAIMLMTVCVLVSYAIYTLVSAGSIVYTIDVLMKKKEKQTDDMLFQRAWVPLLLVGLLAIGLWNQTNSRMSARSGSNLELALVQ